MNYKSISNNINKIFFAGVSISLFSVMPLFWERNCSEYEKSKFCKATKIASTPARTLLDGYYSTITLARNYRSTGKLSNSGLISKKSIDTKKRFIDLKPGFEFHYEPGSRPNAGYLVLSRANPDFNGKPSIELWDLNNQLKIHEYDLDINKIIQTIGLNNASKRKLRFVHPLILNDGSLLVTNIGGPLLKLDKCGNYMKTNNDFLYHHSLEMSEDGFIYAPTNKAHKGLDMRLHTKEYNDEGFAILDQDLNLISSYSLLDIYEKNNLDFSIYGFNLIQMDPFHLNDVEPYTNKKGDKIALLSLRTHSKLIAFDINTEKIIWTINGLGFLQHDIDVLKEENNAIDISFFDNNTWRYPLKLVNKNNKYITVSNLPSAYKNKTFNFYNSEDFTNQEVNFYEFNWLPEKYRSKTIHEGRSDHISKNNSLMLEESNFGRLIEIDLSNKKILWQFVNKSQKDEAPFLMSWSRRMDKLPANINSETFSECKYKL